MLRLIPLTVALLLSLHTFPITISTSKTDNSSSVDAVNTTTADVQSTTTEARLSKTGAQLTTAGAQLTPTGAQLTRTGAQLTTAGAQLTTAGAQLTTAGARFNSTDAQLTSARAQLTTANAQLTTAGAQLTTEDAQPTTTGGHWTTEDAAPLTPDFNTGHNRTVVSEFQNAPSLHTSTDGSTQEVSGSVGEGTAVTAVWTSEPWATTPERQGREFTFSISGDGLQVLVLSPKSGFVQSKNWDGKTTYGRNIRTFAYVSVPVNHTLMISFTDLELQGESPFVGRSQCVDFVSLFLVDRFEERWAWTACELSRPRPRAFDGKDWFKVEFLSGALVSVQRQPLTGFRLHFSFHNASSSPVEPLLDGSWNCSVPHWSDFRLHFRCNLETECSDGRDERGCSYSSSQSCRPGAFWAGGKCFLYVHPRRYVSYKEVKKECHERGGRLASLTTPDVFNQVVRVLRGEWVHLIFVGLETTSFTLPDVYHNLFQWSDGTIAYFIRIGHIVSMQDLTGCGTLAAGFDELWMQLRQECDVGAYIPFLCELDTVAREEENESSPVLMTPRPLTPLTRDGVGFHPGPPMVECPDAHVTHAFLACDDASSCWAKSVLSHRSCAAPLSPLPPSFTCNDGVQHVPYTLVCDHRADCSDQSDEDFCEFPQCQYFYDYNCGDRQCIREYQVCDGSKQCVSGNDEAECRRWKKLKFDSAPAPAIVNFGANLTLNVTSLGDSLTPPTCPDTHFLCVPHGYCLPVFLRCNGVVDCPGRTDEMGCERYACPGYYRCRASEVCLHPDHVCDGVFQCPQQDDELLCSLQCPPECLCLGWAFYCSKSFSARDYLDLRYLDGAFSMMKPSHVQSNLLLVYLSLASCRLKSLRGLTMPNLRVLDLRDNELIWVRSDELNLVPLLTKLYLAGNSLSQQSSVEEASKQYYLRSLQVLDLSRIPLTKINTGNYLGFPNLKTINYSDCGIKEIAKGFGFLTNIEVIDLRGSDVTIFPNDLFSGLTSLHTVYADNFKLCCPEVLPTGFNLFNCHAPTDEISSCGDLLRSTSYRVLLFVLATLAIIGNIGSFIARICCDPSKILGFGVLVTHLCVADFLMGVYLLIIGIADQLYRGDYVWKDVEWKTSVICKLAGFLSFVSSEVSAFTVCLITLDRFLILRFPFSRVRFSRWSAHVASVMAWTVGIALAAVPLLPHTAHWDFYGQSGICIPLPITRQEFAGHAYSFGVMIVFNFVLFLMIALGQICIYWSIKVNSMSSSSTSKKLSKDMTIARRLITIAVTDFLCWFPIGLLGLMAASGIPIPGELNVALAIVALPLNSAVNPFLYTLNTILERRRQAKQALQSKMHSFVAGSRAPAASPGPSQ